MIAEEKIEFWQPELAGKMSREFRARRAASLARRLADGSAYREYCEAAQEQGLAASPQAGFERMMRREIAYYSRGK